MLRAPAGAQPAAQPIKEDDEEFPTSDVVWGKRIDREQCEATRDAVWVERALGGECIRRYPSANVQGVKSATLFFAGDNLDGRIVIGYSLDSVHKLRKEANCLGAGMAAT